MDLVGINTILNIFVKLKDGVVWLFKTKPKFKKSPYYFKNYHKHVTIYENGNGITINSFDIVFNNKEEQKINRGINIRDGKICAEFTDLETMKGVDIKNRFDKYGFWVYSDDNIIEESKEEYWLDKDKEQEDVVAKNDKKELRWVFKFNMGKIELYKPYHVVYVMSIPGMYPISNGEIDKSEININNSDTYSSSSSIKIKKPVEQLKYTVSFYKSIDLKSKPTAIFKEIGSINDSYPSVTNEYNIIYDKYICYIKKPKLGSELKLRWKFKGG